MFRFLRVETGPVLDPNFSVVIRARFEFESTILGEVDESDFIGTCTLVDLFFRLSLFILLLLVDAEAGVIKTHGGQELAHDLLKRTDRLNLLMVQGAQCHVDLGFFSFPARHIVFKLVEVKLRSFGLWSLFSFETVLSLREQWAARLLRTELSRADTHRVELHLVASKRACFISENVVDHS